MRKLLMTVLLVCTFVVYTVPMANAQVYGDKRWRLYVDTAGDLPAVGNLDGDVRLVADTASLYYWDAGTASWTLLSSGTASSLVNVSAADTVAGYLNDKLQPGDALTTSIGSPGANETVDISVLYDDSSIGLNVSNELEVKTHGIQDIMIDPNVAGLGLKKAAAGEELEVYPDDITIGHSSSVVGAIEIKDGSIRYQKFDTTNAPTSGYVLSYDGAELAWVFSPAETMSVEVTQALHGFAIGTVLRWDPAISENVRAQADSATNAEVLGIVSNVIDANTFQITFSGIVGGLAGLTPGEVYFLSPTVAGSMTVTAPSTIGHISKPIFLALTVDSGLFVNWRGVEVGADVAPADASFITVSAEGALSDERVLTGTANQITVTDNGAGSTIVLSTPQSIDTAAAVTFATVNTGQGANELYAMNQDVETSDAVTFATVNTGHGANELYAMNQDVETSDNVTFAQVSTASVQPSGGDNTGNIGGAAARFSNIYGTNIYSGDIIMLNDWVITEDWDGDDGILLRSPDGRTFRFLVEEVEECVD
jgi:hypothetical protein